ncbi:MAG: lipid-A-disaccharide synthase [Planctomycetota bacterium]
MHKVIIVAGESSGDMHGSNLAKALKELEPDIQLFGLGGKRMEQSGVSIFRDVTKHAAVGIFEGIITFPRLFNTFFSFLAEIKKLKPDLVVLIDYPEFNLRLAKRLKHTGIPVIYYICPQVWAWREYRLSTLATCINKLLVILPFEEKYYRRRKIAAEYVGHPALDYLDNITISDSLRKQIKVPSKNFLIGLLPGSRRTEVRRLFPLLKESVALIKRKIPNTSFVVGLAPGIKEYRLGLEQNSDIKIWHNAYEVMKSSDLLLTCSGTATLEAAILGTPMIVFYRVSILTWVMCINLLRTKNYALCNIVAEKRVVPELIQWQATPSSIAANAVKILNSSRLSEIRKEFVEVKKKLGKPGASKRAAQSIINFLRGRD